MHPHHSHKDARGEEDLVEGGEGPFQVSGRHLLDVEGIEAHDQPTEEAKHQASHDQNLKGPDSLGREHETGAHHRESVHNEDGVPSVSGHMNTLE